MYTNKLIGKIDLRALEYYYWSPSPCVERREQSFDHLSIKDIVL